MKLTMAIRFLSSWWITAILSLALCCSYIYFVFAGVPYEKWISFILRTPTGLILYIGLIISIVSTTIRIAHSRLKRRETSSETIKNMDAYIEIPVSGGNPLNAIKLWAKKKGFLLNDLSAEQKAAVSLKARLSFLPGTIMRIGLIILMVSFLLSAHIRRSEEKVFHEGEKQVLLGRDIHLIKIKSDMPEEFLQAGEKDTFRLNQVYADISVLSQVSEIEGGLPSRLNGLYYRITHLGINQPILIRGFKKEFLKNADIDILPPGKSDSIMLSQEGVILSLALQPEKTITKGLVTGKIFNLKKPLYGIILQREKDRDTTENIKIRAGETISIGKTTIALGRHSLFVKIQSVYDPALLWIYAGIIITISGMALMLSRFFWYEKQLSVVIINNMVALIGYREEFYKKWGIMKFNRWKCELSGAIMAEKKSTQE